MGGVYGNRDAPIAERAGDLLELACKRRGAIGAAPVLRDAVAHNAVPVAHDERCFAACAVSGAAFRIEDIAGCLLYTSDAADE